MIQNEEQIFIVCPAIKGTPDSIIEAVKTAISTFKLKTSIVTSVITNPYIFEIPAGNSPGYTLNRELVEQLESSIAAIIFIDELRPNIAYELGYFHGQGKPTLLITKNAITKTWKGISDLAGCALLTLRNDSLETGVHNFLSFVFEKLSQVEVVSLNKMPSSKRNYLKTIIGTSRIPVIEYDSDFGECIKVNTWGGYIFDVDLKLFSQSKFLILLRKIDSEATYSIYFRLRFINYRNERKTIWIGLTSSRVTTGFESNERNLPSEPISNDWCLLYGSFESLLKKGQILGKNIIEHLELIRVRAEYNDDRMAKMPSYEIGYFEIIGIK